MFTHLLRRHPMLGLVAGLVGSAVLVLVGLAGLLAAANDAAGLVFMGLVVAVGLLTAASWVAEATWVRRRPFARLATTPEGRPATVLPFASTSVWVRSALMVLVLAAAVAGLVVALDAGSTGWVVICAVVGLLTLVPLVPVLAGRVRPGAVHVTSEGVELHRYTTRWRVRWDDLEGVVPRDDLVPLVVKPGASVERRQGGAYGWRGAGSSKDPRLLAVPTRYLSVDGDRLAAFLVLYLAHPRMRADLGTQESLDWAHEPTP